MRGSRGWEPLVCLSSFSLVSFLHGTWSLWSAPSAQRSTSAFGFCRWATGAGEAWSVIPPPQRSYWRTHSWLRPIEKGEFMFHFHKCVIMAVVFLLHIFWLNFHKSGASNKRFTCKVEKPDFVMVSINHIGLRCRLNSFTTLHNQENILKLRLPDSCNSCVIHTFWSLRQDYFLKTS